MNAPSAVRIKGFRSAVYSHYRRNGRDLPWRRTRDPYKILVSEIMLQQTQVPRVIEKYDAFVREFRDIASLAKAPLDEILASWQGLGYNRRALALKRLGGQVLERHGGSIPVTLDGLDSLPGVGKATAAAVCAYAYNKPVVFIETNIRTVFIHHFFKGRSAVRDEELVPYLEAALDRRNPRRWYSALMDYGVYLKKRFVNPSRKSAHYKRQGPFAGSDRQVRGALIRALLGKERLARGSLARQWGVEPARLARILVRMKADGLVAERQGRIFLPRTGRQPGDGSGRSLDAGRKARTR